MRKITSGRKIYKFFTQKWFLTAFILTSASHWFVFLKIMGKDVGLIKEDGSLTLLANIITWPLFTVSLLFALLKSAADRYNNQVINKGHFILERILQSANNITTRKMLRFWNFIKEHYDKKDITPFKDITQPKEQINAILDNLQVTLSEVFGINRNDINITIIYKLDSEDWDWFYIMNGGDHLDLKTLVNNQSTTIWRIINGERSSIFFADKREGVNKNMYLPDKKDQRYDNIGSILCRDISIGTDRKFVKATLSISTYGKQFCKINDKEAKKKIENLIIDPFVKRLQLEFALHFIKHCMNNKCLICV
ncbi:MAG: hypothetical protein GXP60_05005 [Epsilonproteobacteria bacterium]|nr:hypothetical protein [Campylobacterota bacterium]